MISHYEAELRSLIIPENLCQDFLNYNIQDQISCERIWIPRPISPPREDSHFIADPLKDLEVRCKRSRLLMNRHDHITKMLITGVLPMKSERFRSPSPVPIYDPETGLRQNTLEQMMRRDLELERRECMGEAAKINAEIKIPTNFRPAMKEVKLFIPQNEHPGYNFVGLILGPRGSTQKRLEAETGAKVTIRGKGAAKEGGQIRLDAYGRLPPGWNEETHVHIAAETWDKLDAAIELVEPLLTYVNEEKNIHKTAQMLQLAKMNGTVRLEAFGEDTAGKLMLTQMVNGPKGPDRTGLYQLPSHMLKEVNDQYRRDIALVKGIRVENSEDQFQQFMQELRGSTKLQN
jgi:splicing factor 1